MKTKLISIILILFVIAAAVVFYLTKQNPKSNNQNQNNNNNSNQSQSVVDIAKNDQPDLYRMSGTITSVKGINVEFDSTLIISGAQQNVHVTAILDQTVNVLKTVNGKQVIGSVSDLKPGVIASFATYSYPYDSKEIHPFQVRIMSSQ